MLLLLHQAIGLLLKFVHHPLVLRGWSVVVGAFKNTELYVFPAAKSQFNANAQSVGDGIQTIFNYQMSGIFSAEKLLKREFQQ